MTVKSFFFGISLSFGIPFLVMLLIPFSKMRSIEPVQFDEVADERTDFYQPKHNGRLETGSMIFAKEGCWTCHTSVTRPTYAGEDVLRDGQGGLKADPDLGDTRRISHPWDYEGVLYANIGNTRQGPDLGNFGRRLDQYAHVAKEKGESFDAEAFVYQHLFNPRSFVGKEWSICSSGEQFFQTIDNNGQSNVSFGFTKGDARYIPNKKGRALVSYLMNLRRDDAVPSSMQYKRVTPAKKEAKK